MPLSSTLTIQSYLGLRKDSWLGYKEYVDIDGDGDFEKDELLDANYNGKVEDKEAWDFLARHAYRPEVSIFINDELSDSMAADLKSAPDNEKIELLGFLLGYSKTNAAFFTLKVMQALTALRNHENEKIRNLSREIIYNKFTYSLPVSEPIEPIKPSEPFKLRKTSPFWPLLSLEISLPAPSVFMFGEKGQLDLANTPFAVASDNCCKYYLKSFVVGNGAFDYELMLYLFNILGIGVGVGWDTVTREQGEEEALPELEANFQFVGPILEGRIPFYSWIEKEKHQVGFFSDYIPYWLRYDINVRSLEGEEYTLGRINSSLLRAGFYYKMNEDDDPNWFVFETRVGGGYRIMELEKVEHADIANQTNFYLSYSPWGFVFSLRLGSKILGSW